MRRPNLTPPRPVTHELRPGPRVTGTRASAWQPDEATPQSSGGTLRVAAVVLLTLAAAGVFLAAPYRSADQLGRALAAGDAQRLDEVIDFAALRDDLKRQTAAAIGEQSDGTPAGLALAGAALANATIDAVVQPETVAKLKDLPVDAVVRARLQRAVDRARLGYDSASSFTIRLVLADVSDEPVKIRLGRAGLITWRAQGVTLPSDLSRLAELAAAEQPAAPPMDGIARVD